VAVLHVVVLQLAVPALWHGSVMFCPLHWLIAHEHTQAAVIGPGQPFKHTVHALGAANAILSPANRLTETISATPIIKQIFSILFSQFMAPSGRYLGSSKDPADDQHRQAIYVPKTPRQLAIT
jgi:hypothetical protein